MELRSVAVSVIRIGGFSQKIVELLSQAFHGSVNVSETHALAGDRGKLLLHRVDELCGQRAVIGHGRIDGVQHSLLERPFVQRRRMQAVSLSIVQAARTAPYRALFAVLCPYDASVGCAAFRAEQQSAERVLAAEFAASGGSTFPCASILCTAPRNFKLHSIEHLAADDSFMVVLNEDFGKLPCIQYCFFADTILDEGFLKQSVPAVFFIGEDGAQVAGGPFRRPGSIADTAGLQRLADVLYAFSGKVAFKNPTNRLCFFRNDLRITIHPFLIAQHGFILKGDLAVLDGLTLAPADISGDGFTFGLGEGGVERNEEFAFRVDGVDVLLLEDHGDAETSQLTGIADGIQRVSGEAGDRLGEDHIDLALPALADHAKELLAPAGGGSCDALVREDVHHRPIRILHDLLGVVRFLVLIAGQLLFITGGYAAVSGDAQISFLCLFLRGFLFRWNDNDFSFRTRLCHEQSHSFRKS